MQEIALYKLTVYLKSIGCQALLEKYSDWFELTLLYGDVSDYRKAISLAVIDDVDLDMTRLNRLIKLLNEDAISITMLELCITEAVQPFLSRMFVELDGFYGISFEFAFRVMDSVEESDFSNYSDAYTQFEMLSAILLSKPRDELFFCQPFKADERLFGFLNKSDVPDKHLEGICELCLCESSADIYVGSEYIPQIVRQLEDFSNPTALLQISGADGVGKRFLLTNACMSIGKGLVMADWSIILEHEIAEIRDIIKRLIREAIFYGFAICLHGLTEENAAAQKDAEKLILLALEPIRRFKIKTILLTQDAVNIRPYDSYNIGRIEIKNHTRNERIIYWENFCKQYNLQTKLDCVSYASNFILTSSEIEKAVLDLHYQELTGTEITKETVANACYNAIKTLRQGNIKKITTTYTLDDLKLPCEQKQALQSLCNHVVYRHQVYDTWGMESRYPYGRGVSALFTGPPGTGKTMAAHILSEMIHMQLYRIDLSQVVDKYIGETEKRLEEIFNTAEKSNVILFFDEADAIFGKRSEVNDAKDKYANTETSYILQRIEEYDGIVILATNYKKNIDEAFMRRIRYLVEFPLPNAQIREEIWRSAFTKDVPMQGIDFGYLARQFELSGGSIKNIVLNSVFLAAGEGGALTMPQILSCVKRENQKVGRSMIPQDFGEYSHLFMTTGN